MKRIVFLIFLFSIVACEENFSPKIEFEEKYVASCVFGSNGESESIGIALYLSHTYDVDGTNPSVNKTDPTVSGAKVWVSYGSFEMFELLEDTLAVYDTTKTDSLIWAHFNRYNNPTILYQNVKVPIRTSPLSLYIELPDGTILTAETRLPKGIFFEYSYNFPHGITSAINQWKNGDSWGVYWEPIDDQLYFTKLSFSYSVNEDGLESYHMAEIPLDYVIQNGKTVPVYPSYKKIGNYEFKFSAIDKVLKLIGEGIEDKSLITVFEVILSIEQFSPELANYYTSINGFLDEYSVRLDDKVYSNIENGLGIFGAYRSTNIVHTFDKDYIHSFGYKTRGD